MLTASWLLIAPAMARTTSLADIPNGQEADCTACHGELPALNWFGTDALLTYEDGRTSWANLFALDSDLDGQTNGMELGDPCGVWTKGDTPWSTEISDPSDGESLLAGPDSPECPEDSGTPDDTGHESERLDCLYSSLGPRPATWILLCVGLSLVWVRRST